MNTLKTIGIQTTLGGLFLAWSSVQAAAADLKVPADHPTIQAAVTAASNGDTIHIASGVYTEQVRITSKRLTLTGQPGAILRATAEMRSSPASPARVVPIMEIGSSSEVTVRGLTFEGERLAQLFPDPDQGDLEGMLIHGSSSVVENCAFYGFREETPGSEGGVAIVFVNIGINEVSFRLSGCTFADNYGGVLVSGSRSRRSVHITIENNTIIGLGPVANVYNYSGIELGPGVGGRIANNTISGYSYIGSAAQFRISFGILASDNPVFSNLPALQIEGNTLRNNQMHIALTKAHGSVIQNNRFQGTAPGIAPLGVAISGTNITIANNQFEGMPEGIRLQGNEPLPDDFPGLGDILGFAINAQVTSNVFCNVTTPVNRQTPATATETGTLSVCPIPPPPLAIAPAVLVSWPGEANGWTVESASHLDGPWAVSSATSFLQDGRHNIAVPTDGAQQLFRLR